MKGSYWFKAKSKKVLFEFSIRRNITIIKGDSATGKTTLLRILYEYLKLRISQSIRNFWQKYWLIQRCGCCSIHWRRR